MGRKNSQLQNVDFLRKKMNEDPDEKDRLWVEKETGPNQRGPISDDEYYDYWEDDRL